MGLYRSGSLLSLVRCGLPVNEVLTFTQDAAVSKAFLIGEDRSDRSAVGVELFSNPRNQLVSTASVIMAMANDLGFDPKNRLPEQNGNSFKYFQFMWGQLDGFNVVKQAYKRPIQVFDASHNNNTFNNLAHVRQQIERLYNPFKQVNVAQAIVDQFPAMMTTTELTKPGSRNWALSVITLDQDSQLRTTARLATLSLTVNVSIDLDVYWPPHYVANFTYIEILANKPRSKSNLQRIVDLLPKKTSADFLDHFTTKF
ncbi:hypothetical protein DFQ27_003239 [Actinomortierella ambigua]|uniref:Uncharacterized protein n=1 Tax=Actinomortierella ambigua TaxID=1343610 RepID=A0A9P6U5U7_9FUNG|nr:hypothetical protein DFQ27_003239 [Actinomortierella ambigua]